MLWHLSLPIIIADVIKVWSTTTRSALNSHPLHNGWLNLCKYGDLALIPLEKIYGWLEGVEYLNKIFYKLKTLGKVLVQETILVASTLPSLVNTKQAPTQF